MPGFDVTPGPPARKATRGALVGLLAVALAAVGLVTAPLAFQGETTASPSAGVALERRASARAASARRTPDPAPSDPRVALAAAPRGASATGQWAAVTRIVDGDTLALRAQRPGPALNSTSVVTVRLLLVDTPETKKPNTPVQCFGPQATAYLTRLTPVGSPVWVAADVERRDRYGRYLLYLWTARGAFVNQQIVATGHGKVLVVEPNHAYLPALRAAEQAAQRSRAGLWGACPAAAAVRPLAEPVAPRTTKAAAVARAGCDSAYPDVCIPPPSKVGDLDCGDVPYRRFRVVAPDPHRFDGDHDGVGCES